MGMCEYFMFNMLSVLLLTSFTVCGKTDPGSLPTPPTLNKSKNSNIHIHAGVIDEGGGMSLSKLQDIPAKSAARIFEQIYNDCNSTNDAEFTPCNNESCPLLGGVDYEVTISGISWDDDNVVVNDPVLSPTSACTGNQRVKEYATSKRDSVRGNFQCVVNLIDTNINHANGVQLDREPISHGNCDLVKQYDIDTRLSMTSSTTTVSETCMIHKSPSRLLQRNVDRCFRRCKCCEAIKPERAHHCRICKKCVLKMDHHCPWVDNCIGERNYKIFLLLLLYTSLATMMMGLRDFIVVWEIGMNPEHKSATGQSDLKGSGTEGCISNDTDVTNTGNFFLNCFSLVLSLAIFIIISGFLVFHSCLSIVNMTTIEFCEKQYKRVKYQNPYNHGIANNLAEVFGTNPFLWLVPTPSK